MIKVVTDIIKDAELGDQDVDFEQFLAMLKEAEQRMASKGNKPDIENYSGAKPSPVPLQQSEELVVELNAKVMDFLR